MALIRNTFLVKRMDNFRRMDSYWQECEYIKYRFQVKWNERWVKRMDS